MPDFIRAGKLKWYKFGYARAWTSSDFLTPANT